MGLILVDSSVWIDWLDDRTTLCTTALRDFIVNKEIVLMGDLVLTEVLQGARHDRLFRDALAHLSLFEPLAIMDQRVAVAAAYHYRTLRKRGITIRKTIDTLIATRCILDAIPLLYSDRDFNPFVEHFGLVPAIAAHTGVSQ